MNRTPVFLRLTAVLSVLIVATPAGAQPDHRPPPAPGPAPREPHRALAPVDRLPRGHRVIKHGPDRYYFANGVWYRPAGPRFVVAAPPIGIVVPVLPPVYTVLHVAGAVYYHDHVNDVYYMRRPRDGYVVVAPPEGSAAVAAQPTQDQLFVYPRQGQSEKQQASDRYECHAWAVSQTGFNTTLPNGGVSPVEAPAKRADYHRAIGACLDARGYTVK